MASILPHYRARLPEHVLATLPADPQHTDIPEGYQAGFPSTVDTDAGLPLAAKATKAKSKK